MFEDEKVRQGAVPVLRRRTAMMESVQRLAHRLDESLGRYPALRQAESATGVPKQLLVLVVIAATALVLLVGLGIGMLCDLVGTAMPVFYTVKALESSERAEWTQWCSYWVIFYNLRAIESFGISTILFWCPFYYAFKLALLVWCFLPTTHGAAFLYTQFWREPAARSTAWS